MRNRSASTVDEIDEKFVWLDVLNDAVNINFRHGAFLHLTWYSKSGSSRASSEVQLSVRNAPVLRD